ncbi:ATP synthase F1, epsilon subunit [Denitrovibrio acetiphilus DSM 12809]|uniref:ATP synthase epsilon chain n=1 Tax=Denitrovibrio acetiphilus (strain DSM 12809 / NBRC 114555 / N2460) TaxID=522772 RepID=D4H618_DENA2|nr:F0F1 ATP synthase subunit epsilon [Denitrovibrio acetiphilus]ADD67664.1 ATP synthase F1, epsilon subunit [Denitrovibrio acetiphilus DSM 12809]
MADTIRLELVTPERMILSEDVEEVIAPGVEGDLGVLPEHAPLLTALRVGEMAYRVGKQIDYIAIVGGGFLEVNNNKVIVLADDAELGQEINLDEAIERKLKAEQNLEQERKADESAFNSAQVQLMKELTRVQIAEKYRAK